ncbi:MAG: hypothetical protein C4289_00110 [Chloroflexota bacterium]
MAVPHRPAASDMIPRSGRDSATQAAACSPNRARTARRPAYYTGRPEPRRSWPWRSPLAVTRGDALAPRVFPQRAFRPENPFGA